MDLSHHHILVVEDEILIGLELSNELSDAGARVIGPAMSVAAALRLIEKEKPSAAIVDVWLGSETSLLVAKTLAAAGIPFILHTGHFTAGLPADWPPAPIVAKPSTRSTLFSALATVLTAK